MSNPQSPGQLAPRRQPLWMGGLLTLGAWLVARLAAGALTPSLRLPWAGLHAPVNSIYPGQQWAWWDAWTYLDISREGRWFAACSPSNIHRMLIVLPGQRWCGNASWLPGYPDLVRLGTTLGLPRYGWALLVSWVALGLALAVFWYAWCRELRPGRAFAAMLLLALFPGSTFMLAISPVATAVLAVVVAAALASRSRWVLGAIAVGFAGYCYPAAFPAELAFAVLALAAAWPRGRRARLAALLPAGLSAWGPAALALGDQLRFGHFDAFWLMQNQQSYESFSWPGLGWLRVVLGMSEWQQQHASTGLATLMAVEALVALLLVVLAVVLVLRQPRPEGWRVEALTPVVLGASVCLGLLVGTSLSAWHRSIVLASVSVVGLRRLPTWALATIAGVLLVLAVGIAPSYLTGKLP